MMIIKVLVVDDSASDRLIIQNMLSNLNILTAADGSEAMDILDKHDDINLLILDLNMPVMDGFQVLKNLRANEKYKKIRTIILTNQDELDNEILGLRLGAVDFIRKPIHMDSLTARIDIHIALIRAQNELEQKLHQQGETFERIFDQVPVGIAISFCMEPISAELNPYFSINPAFEKITGRTRDELLDIGWAAITHPDDLEEDLNFYKKLQSGEIEDYATDKRFIRPDGTVVWVHMLVSKLFLEDIHQFNHISLMKDITENRAIENKLKESERSKSVLLSHLPGLAYRCSFDRKWTMQYVSDGCIGLTGYKPEDLINNREIPFSDLIVPEYRDALWKEWERVLNQQLPCNFEYEIKTASGKRKWVLELGQGIFDNNGEVQALEGIMIDITDRKTVENALIYNNEHDRWTGLHNRSYLENILSDHSEQVLQNKRALISVNLSSLQKLTTSYGFHYTQALISKIAQALNTYCTENLTLFYTYENRFVFYIMSYNDRKDLETFSRSIIRTLEPFLAIERIGGGIGIIEVEPNNDVDADKILKNLLIASEKAAQIGNGDFEFCFYDSDIEKQIIREQEIKLELNQISEDENDGGLFLQYQPIFDLKLNQICGFEALARITSNKLGRIPPLEFIPIAEETKIIIPIGNKVIRQAFRFLNKLRDLGFDAITVSINVSVIQFLKKGFYETFLEMIKEMKVSPKNIGIEITESIFASNYQEINKILAQMKEDGIRIYVDDFGTGYSSLSRERELNVNYLKIDKSFIDYLLSSTPEKSTTGEIISMAHKLDHLTIAEGVEHEIQREYLSQWGCDMIQGYLISKPLDEEAAIEMLKQSALDRNFFHTVPS